MNSLQQPAIVSAPKLAPKLAVVTNRVPALGGGLWQKTVYRLFELVFWRKWVWHPNHIHGAPPDEACVLVANHGSYLDWLLLHAILRRKFQRKIQFLAKEKLLRNPVFRALVWAGEAIIVVQSQPARALVLAARSLSPAKAATKPMIGIFPEGKRSRSGQPLPAMSGAAWLARRCGVPIVPVALCGFHEAWPPHRALPVLGRKRLSVHFLPPVSPADFADDQAAVDFAMGQIHEVVRRERAARDKPNGTG